MNKDCVTPRRMRRLTKPQIDELVLMHEVGVPVNLIARRFGIRRDMVWNHLRAAGQVRGSDPRITEAELAIMFRAVDRLCTRDRRPVTVERLAQFLCRTRPYVLNRTDILCDPNYPSVPRALGLVKMYRNARAYAFVPHRCLAVAFDQGYVLTAPSPKRAVRNVKYGTSPAAPNPLEVFIDAGRVERDRIKEANLIPGRVGA